MKQNTLILGMILLASAAAVAVSGSENETSIRELQLVKFVQPIFPSQLQTVGLPVGDVTVAVSRDASGAPTDILTLESTHELFAAAALEAVGQWRFTPSSEASLAKSPPVILRIRFSLQGVIVLDPTLPAAEAAALQSDRGNRPVLITNLQALEGLHEPISLKMPAYPATMAVQGVEGEAKVAFYIDREGKVRMPHVVATTTPEFGATAIAAVSDWRFNPPKKKGGATVATDSWSFEFKRKG